MQPPEALAAQGFPEKKHKWGNGILDRAGLTGRLSRSVPAGNLPEPCN